MNSANTFPIPFKSLRIIRGGKDGHYIIGAMFTAAYAEKARRLAASCEKFTLPYAIHEVPTVHHSISSRGTDDPSYTKANFIRHLLAAHNKPVLYLDADCEFAARPELIDELVKSRCDFAIYNWFSDMNSDCFVPIELGSEVNEPPIGKRFYRLLGSECLFSDKQLKCNGLVQFYRNSVAARNLLSRWHKTIMKFPRCTDDEAMTFTFNNLRSWLLWFLKVRWLPKSYARISWWIHTEPVINHPDLPTRQSGFVRIEDPSGLRTFYQSLMKQKKPGTHFPEDCIIDTEQRWICKLVDGRLVKIEPTSLNFWL